MGLWAETTSHRYYISGHGYPEIVFLEDRSGDAFNYDELVSRDKASLDIFWLKDESLEASDNLPDPDVIAQEIVEDLEAALEQFREIVGDLGSRGGAVNE